MCEIDERALYERIAAVRFDNSVSENEVPVELRELFGFWKNLYPDMIERALNHMTATDWSYEDYVTSDESIKGQFFATVELRDNMRPEFPSVNQYCYDAAVEAVRKISILRNQRAIIRNNAVLRRKLEKGAKSEGMGATPKAPKSMLQVYTEMPFRLDQKIGQFKKGFTGYLTITMFIYNIDEILDCESQV
jgi:hypothetical protein